MPTVFNPFSSQTGYTPVAEESIKKKHKVYNTEETITGRQAHMLIQTPRMHETLMDKTSGVDGLVDGVAIPLHTYLGQCQVLWGSARPDPWLMLASCVSMSSSQGHSCL